MALTPDQIAAANAGSAQAAAIANLKAGVAPGVAAGTPTVPASVTTPAPINRSVDTSTDPTTDPAGAYLDTFTPPQSEADIAAQKQREAQALIDSTNALYDTQVQQEQQAGQKRLDQNNAVSVLSGLSGSTDAVRTSNDVTAGNTKSVDAINAQRAVALQAIYGKISDDAATEAEQQKQDAQKSAEDVVAHRTQVQTDAVNNLKLMAASGAVDFDSFKNNPQNAQVYQYALQAFGGSEDALRGFMTLNKPQDTVLNSGIAPDGHTYYQVSKNPITGNVTTDHFDLGFTIPQGSQTVQLANGDLMFVPKDGIDPSKPIADQVQVYKGSPDPLKAAQLQGVQLDNEKKANDLKAANGATTVPITDPNTGKTITVPVDVAPYVATSHSGVAYADLSAIQGTAAQKSQIVNEAQAAGIKVITNKSTATDLFNIGDANNKLDTVVDALANIDQPSAFSRDLYGGPFSMFATMAQTDPQKAAAAVLSSIGTDILKAMQGVQGSRMSQAAVANINKELPTIYDTNDTVQQKVANLKALLSDREDAILGQAQASDGSSPSDTSSDTDPLGLGI